VFEAVCQELAEGISTFLLKHTEKLWPTRGDRKAGPHGQEKAAESSRKVATKSHVRIGLGGTEWGFVE
jgi:hypothetical protein